MKDADGTFVLTNAPWKIKEIPGEKPVKALARRGPYSQYKRGTRVPPIAKYGEQEGIICSIESETIVLDFDAFEHLAKEHPFDLSGPWQSTGRPGGRHHIFDGEGITPEDWPVQHHFSWGDVKARGFVPYPGSVHPNGAVYELHDEDAGIPKWDPEWTRWLEREWEREQRELDRQWQERRGSSPARGPNDPEAGRNNALYEMARSMHRDSQPEKKIIQAVEAANDEFGEPLSDGELYSTVLRPGRWIQPEWVEQQWQEEEEEEEETKAQVSAIVPFRRKTRSSKGDNLPDQPRCITAIAELDRKWRAEQHDDELSIDWESAPEGTRQLYDDLYAAARFALTKGGPRAEAGWKPGGSMAAQLQWLCHGNCWPLVEQLEGSVLLLADRPGDPQDPYPGCPENVNPLAGEVLGADLQVFLVMLTTLPEGKELTDKQRARIANSPEVRKLLGWEGRCRYASIAAVRKARQRLCEAGALRKVREARMYRDRHRWALARPARHEVQEGWEMTECAPLRSIVVRFLIADREHMRRQMAA